MERISFLHIPIPFVKINSIPIPFVKIKSIQIPLRQFQFNSFSIWLLPISNVFPELIGIIVITLILVWIKQNPFVWNSDEWKPYFWKWFLVPGKMAITCNYMYHIVALIIATPLGNVRRKNQTHWLKWSVIDTNYRMLDYI